MMQDQDIEVDIDVVRVQKSTRGQGFQWSSIIPKIRTLTTRSHKGDQ